MKATTKTRPRPLGSGWLLAFPCLLVAVCVSPGGEAVSHGVAPNQQAQAVRIARIEDDVRVIDERGEDTSDDVPTREDAAHQL
jgi:hypothetical protein